ncbi:MAG: hypothetical protein AB1664_12310 [Thermodesulfobacteriota bacterium]
MSKLKFYTQQHSDKRAGEFDPNANYHGWAPTSYSRIGNENDPNNHPLDKLVRIHFFKVDDHISYVLDGFLTHPESIRHIDRDDGPLQERIPACLNVARILKLVECEYEADEEDVPDDEDPENYCVVEKRYLSVPFPAGLCLYFFYEAVDRVFDVPVPKETHKKLIRCP